MQITEKKAEKIRMRDVFFMPLGCLLQSSPVLALVLIITLIFASDYIYYNLNIDLPGYSAPSFDNWSISQGFNEIQDEKGYTWQITYEQNTNSNFIGTVRHVSPIRENKFPMLSHDILVTSVDFADSSLVNTNVSNHHFVWVSLKDQTPTGNINLLHTVPLNDDIRNQLLVIRNGDQVRIRGREIYEVFFFKDEQKWNSMWKDAGCNTLLVTSVEIISPH
ncbi:MAG: hypothetical protein CVU39_03535 [Chloroflexi bacterium HGW-Chloroflexi-10]|nr:MAG: hypothetical protein CVU39_03535 [Chloroflexi bacterium HGW-Chloroflexi-10]